MSVDIELVRITQKDLGDESCYLLTKKGYIKYTDIKIPDRLKKYIIMKEVKRIAVTKELENLGYSINDVEKIDHNYGEKLTHIELKNGDKLIISWEKLDMYSTMEPFICIETIDYLELRYLNSKWWKKTPVFCEETHKYIKEVYWTPEEMNITDPIFSEEGLKKWNEIKEKFRELYGKGEPVFVWVSW